MRAGKIQESVLKRSVLKSISVKRKEVITGAAVGTDCAVLGIEKCKIALTSNTFSMTQKDAGIYAVSNCINDLVSAKAEPLGILLNIMMPSDSEESELKHLMRQVSAVCEKENIQIMGGHTEVLPAVSGLLISITGLGKMKETKSESVKKTDLDIVVTKWIGLEGTRILLGEKEKELRQRFSESFLDNIKTWDENLSVRPEAELAEKYPVFSMHNVSEGGIFGALWELAQASGVGMEVDLKKIPVRQETIEICEQLEMNPYELNGNGSLLLFMERGYDFVWEAAHAGIPASVIGRTTGGKDRVIRNREEKRFLEPAKPDELYKLGGKENARKDIDFY